MRNFPDVIKSGKVFKNYKILKTDQYGIKIVHQEGFSLIRYSDLPKEMYYKYSPNVLISKSGVVYENYKITAVSHNKVEILCHKGLIWIPHEELPQKLLEKYSSEIQRKKEMYAQKQRKKQAELTMAQAEQTEELKQFLSNLQKMSWKELLLWSKKRVGIYLYKKEFEEKFLSVFSEAKNKYTVLKELKSRRTAQFNKSLMNFAEELSREAPNVINNRCRRLFGVAYSDKNFRKKLVQYYVFSNKIDTFFSVVDKSIENHLKAEKKRLEAEKKRLAEEERRKKEKEEKEIKRKAEVRRKIEEKKRKWNNELKAKGLSPEDVTIPVSAMVFDASLRNVSVQGRMLLHYEYEYRLYVNDQLFARRETTMSFVTFEVRVPGNSKIRVDIKRRGHGSAYRLTDSQYEFGLKEAIADYPGKGFIFECM